MIISVASGKGGTGKTTIATNLVMSAERAAYVDCDVEEPNGFIFLKPDIKTRQPVFSLVPRVELSGCTFCGLCRDVCRFNALAVLPSSVLVFDELCHSCGGCVLACPEKTMYEEKREIGVVERGSAGGIPFVHGKLAIGEAMSPPLIRAVKRNLPVAEQIVLDAPPGTSCPAVASVLGTDVCLLVAEPTPFGLHDLRLATEMVRVLDIPFGVCINRDGIGDDHLIHFCEEQKIPILARIPESRKLAEAYSKGILAIDAVPELKPLFKKLLSALLTMGKDQAMSSTEEKNKIGIGWP